MTYYNIISYGSSDTANLRTRILDFSGFDSSITLILRGGISRPIGNDPEMLSQGILVGTILVGRLRASRSQSAPLSNRIYRSIGRCLLAQYWLNNP